MQKKRIRTLRIQRGDSISEDHDRYEREKETGSLCEEETSRSGFLLMRIRIPSKDQGLYSENQDPYSEDENSDIKEPNRV